MIHLEIAAPALVIIFLLIRILVEIQDFRKELTQSLVDRDLMIRLKEKR